MNDRDWNYEELTEEEARLRHTDCEMIVNGEERRAPASASPRPDRDEPGQA